MSVRSNHQNPAPPESNLRDQYQVRNAISGCPAEVGADDADYGDAARSRGCDTGQAPAYAPIPAPKVGTAQAVMSRVRQAPRDTYVGSFVQQGLGGGIGRRPHGKCHGRDHAGWSGG